MIKNAKMKLIIDRITNNLVYYGLSLNAVSLAGTDNKYLNFILVSFVEAPSYIFAWQGMNRFGRRKTLCAALIISGIACFASPFIPPGMENTLINKYKK